MKTSQEILQEAIQGVLTEKALSKEAIEAVQQILKENETLKVTVENQKNEMITDRNIISKLNVELTDKTNKLVGIENRESAVSKREKEADLLDLTVSYEQMRVSDLKEFVGIVFRNTVVRKNVNASVANPGYTNNNYSATVPEYSNEETKEE